MAGVADQVAELFEFRISRPDFGGGLDFFGGFFGVSGDEVCFGLLDGEVGGEGVSGDRGVDFGGWKIFGGLLEFVGEDLATDVVARLEGAVEFVEVADVCSDSEFFLKRKRRDRREEFAEGVCLHQSLGGGVEFVAGEEEVEGFDIFRNFADRLVGKGVERGDGG